MAGMGDTDSVNSTFGGQNRYVKILAWNSIILNLVIIIVQLLLYISFKKPEYCFLVFVIGTFAVNLPLAFINLAILVKAYQKHQRPEHHNVDSDFGSATSVLHGNNDIQRIDEQPIQFSKRYLASPQRITDGNPTPPPPYVGFNCEGNIESNSGTLDIMISPTAKRPIKSTKFFRQVYKEDIDKSEHFEKIGKLNNQDRSIINPECWNSPPRTEKVEYFQNSRTTQQSSPVMIARNGNVAVSGSMPNLGERVFIPTSMKEQSYRSQEVMPKDPSVSLKLPESSNEHKNHLNYGTGKLNHWQPTNATGLPKVIVTDASEAVEHTRSRSPTQPHLNEKGIFPQIYFSTNALDSNRFKMPVGSSLSAELLLAAHSSTHLPYNIVGLPGTAPPSLRRDVLEKPRKQRTS